MKTLGMLVMSLLLWAGVAAQTTELFQSAERANDILEVDGKLWIATQQGVSVMDMETKEVAFYSQHNSNLPGQDVKTITLDQDGNIWVGTYDLQLARWDGADWEHMGALEFPEDLQTAGIHHLYCLKFDENNVMWAGCSHGLCKFEGEEATYYSFTNTGQNFLREVWDMEFDDQGGMIVVSQHLFKFDENGWYDFTGEQPDLFSYGEPDVKKYENGSLWFTNQFSSYSKLEDNQWTSYDITSSGGGVSGSRFIDLESGQPGLLKEHGYFELIDDVWHFSEFGSIDIPNEMFNNHFRDSNEVDWVFAGGYVTNTEDPETNNYISSDPLASNSPRQIVADHAGNVFVSHGYFELSMYSEAEGLKEWGPVPHPYIEDGRAMFGDPIVADDNSLWMTNTTAVSRFDGENWTHYGLGSDPQLYPVDFLTAGRNNTVWGYGGTGLFYFDGDDWSEIEQSDTPLNNMEVRGVAVDADDTAWMFTRVYDEEAYVWSSDVVRLKDGQWTLYEEGQSGLPSGSRIRELVVLDDGTPVVFIFDHGFFQLVDDQWESMNLDVAFPFNLQVHDGRLMFLDSDKGIGVWEDGTLSYISTETAPLLSNAIHLFTVDSEDNFWIHQHNIGILKYDADGQSTSLIPAGDSEIRSISISPNPTDAILQVSMEMQNQSPESRLRVYDMEGRLLIEGGSLQSGDKSIDVSGLSAGVYLLQATSPEGSTSLKFIKR